MRADIALHPMCPDDAGFADFGAFFAKWGYGSFAPEGFAQQFSHQSYGLIQAGGDEIQGGLLYRIAADEAEIIEIAVDAAYRQQGVGRKMIGALAAHLRIKDVERLILEVAEDNQPACQLYQRCGFAITGRRPNYYTGYDKAQDPSDKGQKIDAIIMELWLSKA